MIDFYIFEFICLFISSCLDDPDATNFHKHRTFLKDQVNFKEVSRVETFSFSLLYVSRRVFAFA